MGKTWTIDRPQSPDANGGLGPDHAKVENGLQEGQWKENHL